MNPVYFTSGLYLAAVARCLLALVRRGSYEQFVGRFESAFARFAARPIHSVAALFLGIFLLRAALLPILPVPTPEVHDEFSFLLLGDTITHGRLANLTPALWKSFETFHENMYPTYCSKYAPAQGFVLAFGERLGNPWIGVLLSCSLMVAFFHWALRVWMPARWSFLAAILVGLKLGLTSYWMNSFWGGAVPAFAGALALGGLGRVLKRASLSGALGFGGGIAILANSRPYEGLIFSIPLGAIFLWWLAGKTKGKVPTSDRIKRFFLPASVLLLAGVAFLRNNNSPTTATPRTIAISLNQK